MATPAQIAANRQNALHSTGPRTPEGKDAVRNNRRSHGLAGPHCILPGEDPDAYAGLLAALVEHHQPNGPSEEFLVRQMAQAQWKLDRIAVMETRLFERAITAGAAVDPAAVFEQDCASVQVLLKLSRYEAEARRGWSKALSQLHALQTPRRQEDFRTAVDREVSKYLEALLHPPALLPSHSGAAHEDENYDTKPNPAIPAVAPSSKREPVFAFRPAVSFAAPKFAGIATRSAGTPRTIDDLLGREPR